MALLDGIGGVFVIHCKQGYEDRRKVIDEQFKRIDFPFEYVLNWDIAELDVQRVKQQFGLLAPVSQSVCMKHFEAMNLVVARGYSRALIFEDDVILSPRFLQNLKRVLNDSLATHEPHAVYLSNACHKYTPRSRLKRGYYIYENDHSRATDAYLVTESACRLRLKWLEHHRVSTPIDHVYNEMDRELGIRMFWAEPPFVEQGSMTGLYPSATGSRYGLLKTKIRWQTSKFYKKHILRNLR
jgi:glycosyl transferase family 25